MRMLRLILGAAETGQLKAKWLNWKPRRQPGEKRVIIFAAAFTRNQYLIAAEYVLQRGIRTRFGDKVRWRPGWDSWDVLHLFYVTEYG